jgi:hypothetical protein
MGVAPGTNAQADEATKEANYKAACVNFKRGGADSVLVKSITQLSQVAIPADDALLVYLEASGLSSILDRKIFSFAIFDRQNNISAFWTGFIDRA